MLELGGVMTRQPTVVNWWQKEYAKFLNNSYQQLLSLSEYKFTFMHLHLPFSLQHFGAFPTIFFFVFLPLLLFPMKVMGLNPNSKDFTLACFLLSLLGKQLSSSFSFPNQINFFISVKYLWLNQWLPLVDKPSYLFYFFVSKF